jgi:YVTN family beta-propeller protein
VSPNGREIWSAHSRDGGVSVIDVATKKVAHTIALATKRSNRIKLTPDGKFALVSDLDAGDLVVVDAAARKEIKRIALGKMPEGILITPDGSRSSSRSTATTTWPWSTRRAGLSPGGSPRQGPDGWVAWVPLSRPARLGDPASRCSPTIE